MSYEVVFATTNLRHASAQRRIRALKRDGVRVHICSVHIDKSRPGYLRRLPTLLSLLLKVSSTGGVVWAWGLDACFAASVASVFRRRKVVWDISDLLPIQLAKGLRGWLVRWLESVLIRRAHILALTSRGFYEAYYHRLKPFSRVVVIENLLEADLLPTRARYQQSHQPDNLLRVAYAGIFRSEGILRLISKVAEKNPSFHFHLYGHCSREVDPKILEGMARDNVVYHGPYKDPLDLIKIYRAADVVFGLLDVNADLNERALLPNRFYHAGAFGLPIVTTTGTFVGEHVTREHLGATTNNDPDSLTDTLLTLSNPHVRRQIVLGMPPESRFFYSGEYRRTLQLLESYG